MFGLSRNRLKDLTPAEVQAGLAAGRFLVVDVREPIEFAAERIEGAELVPLSRFDPRSLRPGGRQIVLHCGIGKRSAMAAEACAKAGVAIAGHLAGGLAGWKQAGLPTVRG